MGFFEASHDEPSGLCLNQQEDAMRLDVEAQLNAAARCVSSLERDGRSAHSVAVVRSYPTTVADLWDAVTNGRRISRWFLPICGELELNGRFQLEGNAGGVINLNVK